MLKRIDLHCDTLTMLRKKETLAESHCVVSLEGLRQSDTLVQCFAAFIPTGIYPALFRDMMVRKRFSAIFNTYQKTLGDYPECLRAILTVSDIRQCREDGKIGVLFTVEDGGVIGDHIENLQNLYQQGVRLITLTWNHENSIGYPCSYNSKKSELGLKAFGIEVLREMERLGIVVDVSHLSDGGFWDVAKHSTRPFVASHSNARSMWKHPRNLTDEMIAAVADKGGVVGVNFGPEFLGPNKDNRIEDIVCHIQRIYQAGGENVLALGSDFDGIRGDNEVGNPKDCLNLLTALKRVGFQQRVLEKLWCGNAQRVLEDVLG